MTDHFTPDQASRYAAWLADPTPFCHSCGQKHSIPCAAPGSCLRASVVAKNGAFVQSFAPACGECR